MFAGPVYSPVSDLHWHNERRRLGDLTPQPDNPRQIKRDEAERLVESLEDYDQVETLAVSPDGEVYNGHQRLAVWQQKYGPDYEVDVRVASRPLTHKEWARLTVLLHRGTTGDWDWDGLANWEDVDAADLVGWGFDAGELGLGEQLEEQYEPLGPKTMFRVLISVPIDDAMEIRALCATVELMPGAEVVYGSN